jgi:hypothetical protein
MRSESDNQLIEGEIADYLLTDDGILISYSKSILRTIENISIKSSTIENEIRTMIKYFLDILSQRQDFLLKNVDKIQTMKTQTLQRQINELNQVIKQLHLTIPGKLNSSLIYHLIFFSIFNRL